MIKYYCDIENCQREVHPEDAYYLSLEKNNKPAMKKLFICPWCTEELKKKLKELGEKE